MDPLSATTGCLALISAVGKTALAISDFVQSCREAKDDLATVSTQLSELQSILKLLKDSSALVDEDPDIKPLKIQILSIISNCNGVLLDIQKVLKGLTGRTASIKWVAFGKKEVTALRVLLDNHRGSLSIAVQLVSISHTTTIRTDVGTIKEDTSQIPQILEELAHLRALVANSEVSAATSNESYALQKNLDGLVSYADTVSAEKWQDSEKWNLNVPKSASTATDQAESRVSSKSDVPFFNHNINQDCYQKMKKIVRDGEEIIWVAFSTAGRDGWSILCKSGAYFNHNIPEHCHNAMAKLSKDGAKVRRVAFTYSGEGWSIVNDRGIYLNHNIPDECHTKMGELSQNGAKIISVAFPPGRGNSWSIANDVGAYWNRNIPDECHEKIIELSRGAAKIVCVAFPAKGGNSWSVINDRGDYFNRNIPDEAHSQFGTLPNICGPVRVVAFDPNGSGWSVIASSRK
ncbi:hypothetical protein BKA64DRAFT_663677 [Cadophora sp. MPI-SDFR-AT-0126]|nr:hypothetical protein BKA64DRAFT_663677 [Leotiomycetes sp. MPI-SDFR-AT-0126]